MRTQLAAALAVTTLALLTGCSFHSGVSATAEAGYTIQPDELASVMADALEDEVGKRPLIDCGNDSIVLKSGKRVHCDLTAKGDEGTVYDVVGLMHDVDDHSYGVTTKVADTPKERER